MPTGKWNRKLKSILVPIGPSIAYVPLSRGFWSIIDRENAEMVGQFNWTATLNGSGVPRAIGHAGKGRSYSIYLSRFLVSARNLDVDHKNGNTLDNRLSNLRPATRSQNCRNKGARKGLKGASFNKEKRKWRGSIHMNGKSIHLGTFDSEKDAHDAYCRAAERLYGEFARFH
jgi:hypothetical protein